MAEEKKKSLWEQMGRKVPSMTDDVKIKPKKKDEEKKDKSLWEKMGRKPLF